MQVLLLVKAASRIVFVTLVVAEVLGRNFTLSFSGNIP